MIHPRLLNWAYITTGSKVSRGIRPRGSLLHVLDPDDTPDWSVYYVPIRPKITLSALEPCHVDLRHDLVDLTAAYQPTAPGPPSGGEGFDRYCRTAPRWMKGDGARPEPVLVCLPNRRSVHATIIKRLGRSVRFGSSFESSFVTRG